MENECHIIPRSWFTKASVARVIILKRIAHILLLSCFCIAAMSPAVADSLHYRIGERPPDWVNALKPKGTPGPEIGLASRGKAKYHILLPARPTTMEEKAAEDLAHWLGKMTDVRFRIVHEGRGRHPGRVVSVGMTQLLKDANPWQLQTDLGNEGYAIAVQGGNLFLFGGKTRGVINSVYALLEEDLGCRWYDRHSANLPYMPELRFRPVPRKYGPILEIRDPFYWAAFNRDWSLRNRTNAPDARVPEEWGGRMDYALFVHTYEILMPPNEFFADHPEYYSEIKGERKPRQLCLTNPDVFRIVVERVKARLAERPHSEIISVSPNDWEDYCECANCKAIDDAEESRSGSLIWFVNKVAEAIEEEYPDVQVSTLAYLGTFRAPKTIKPRDNVVIRLCTDHHSWTYFFQTITETTRFQQAMKGWAKQDARIHIWDYTINFSHHILPTPNMQVVDYAIKWYARHNASGVMLQGFWGSYGSENAPMRIWVWGKLLWDHTLANDALMRDFIFGYYGDAAESIWQYNNMLTEIWRVNHYELFPRHGNELWAIGCRYGPETKFLSQEFLDRSFKLFEQAEALAEDSEILRRVKFAKLPILYTRLSQDIGYVKQGPGVDQGGRPRWEPGNVSLTAENRPVYQAILDELESVIQVEEIKNFFETRADALERIELWKKELAEDK